MHASMSLRDALLREGKLCTGCGACVATCPTAALALLEDSEGFFTPSCASTKEACGSCSACVHVCPVLQAQPAKAVKPASSALAIAPQASPETFTTRLSRRVLDQDGVVFGPAFDAHWHVHHIMVDRPADLHKLDTFIPLQSQMAEAYKKAKALLQAHRLVLFTGVPCQIAALYAFLGDTPQETLYTMEQMCQGLSSHKVFRTYLKESFPTGDVLDYVFASHERADVLVRMKDGREHRIPFPEDAFAQALCADLVNAPSCSACPFGTLPRQADFTVGLTRSPALLASSRQAPKNATQESAPAAQATPPTAAESVPETAESPQSADTPAAFLLVNSQRGRQLVADLAPLLPLEAPSSLDALLQDRPAPAPSTVSQSDRRHFFLSLGLKPFPLLVDACLRGQYDIAIAGHWWSNRYHTVLANYSLYVLLRSLDYDPVFLPQPAQASDAALTADPDSASAEEVVSLVLDDDQDLLLESEQAPRPAKTPSAPLPAQPGTRGEDVLGQHCNIFSTPSDGTLTSVAVAHCGTFMVGSDDVWDSAAAHGDDASFYFLDWVGDDRRKVSVATPLDGLLSASDSSRKETCKALKSFTALSCSQAHAANWLRQYCQRTDVSVLLDPLLTADAASFDALLPKREATAKQPFVFSCVDSLTSATWKKTLMDAVCEVFTATHILCSDVDSAQHTAFRTSYGDELRTDLSVQAWLSHIQQCCFLVGDNYESLCCALRFHKNFLIVAPKETRDHNPTRIFDLLQLLGLEDRLITPRQQLDDVKALVHTPIDWESVDSLLENAHKNLTTWLRYVCNMPLHPKPKRATEKEEPFPEGILFSLASDSPDAVDISENTCQERDVTAEKWLHVTGEGIQLNDIRSVKKCFGSTPLLQCLFQGELLVKVGLAADQKSYLWLNEKHVAASVPSAAKLGLNLSDVDSGKLEIHLLPLRPSTLYAHLPLAERTQLNTDHVLYSFLFPSYELCCEEQLYVHFHGEACSYSFKDGTVSLGKKTSVDLLTYFNSFTTTKWKKYTDVRHLGIYLDFRGDALVFLKHQTESACATVAQWRIRSSEKATWLCPLPEFVLELEGIIGIHLVAEDESILYGGGYVSTDAPTQNVRLGIGITTYKREKAVKASVERLGRAISAHPLYHDTIDITVVDNGQTLSPDDVPAATLIPNRNLGGTGGFMRNLIHYRDLGSYTHCLFMDDDANCEPGSIFRSLSFLRHATDTSVAISGAMLSENVQFIQWENGAWFDKQCHPLHCNLDLRQPDNLFLNEKEYTENPTYGAWWYFMFPIARVENFTFPFFVRGDDIQFSYMNHFTICRMNGISTWQEDFKTKESPMTLYLDIRSHIVHHMLLQQINNDALTIIKLVWSFFSRFNNSYQYDTANAIVTSFNDMQKGSQYWEENIDTQKIREKIKKKYSIEVKKELRKDYKDLPQIQIYKEKSFIKKLTCYGHLLPGYKFDTNLQRVPKIDFPNADLSYLHKQCLIFCEVDNTEYIVQIDRKYYFKNLFFFCLTASKFFIKYFILRRNIKKFMSGLTKDIFWKKQFFKK